MFFSFRIDAQAIRARLASRLCLAALLTALVPVAKAATLAQRYAISLLRLSRERSVLRLILSGWTALSIAHKALRKPGIARLKPLVFTVGVALLTTGFPLSAQVQADYMGTAVTGQLNLVRVVNLGQKALSPRLFRMARPLGETRPSAAPKRLRPPMLAGASALARPTAKLKSLKIATPKNIDGFNALSHLDQRMANGGNQFSIEPPSPSIAVGAGYVLEGVNDAIQVYSLSGAPALPSVLASNEVFGLDPAIDRATGVNGVYLTDMRVYFDADINRWFILQRSQDNDASGNPLNQSHLYLAVSTTSDPTGDYSIYVMDTTNDSHPGCPCIADYPQLGADQYGFHISWNEFNSSGLFFVDVAILSLSKTALAAGATTPAAFEFFVPLSMGYEFAVQPATTPPGASNFLESGGLEYFVSSQAQAASSNVALWAMRNTSSLATPSPNPILSRVIVPTLPYTFPDVATQRSGPLPYGSSIGRTLAYLDGGDPRVLSLSYANDRLYLTLQTAVRDEDERWVVGGAYVVLSPAFSNDLLSGEVLNQGYLMINGNHLLRPAIAVNAHGKGAIAVTVTGNDWFPTAAMIPFNANSTPNMVKVAGLGALPEDGFTGYPDFGDVGVARWGDYNAAFASSDGSIWMVAEYVGDFERTEYANWNTFVMQH